MNSKNKVWIFVIGAIALVAVFAGGCFAGPHIFKFANKITEQKVEVSTDANLDVLGNGKPVFRRSFFNSKFGSPKDSVLTYMYKRNIYPRVENSENFPGMELAVYENVNIDSTYFSELRLYFYKDKLAMVAYFSTDPKLKENPNQILADLERKYGDLEKYHYSDQGNNLGKINRAKEGIYIPEFYPQWNNNRIASLRDGHTLINLFDMGTYGILVLYYDRMSKWQEDSNKQRENYL